MQASIDFDGTLSGSIAGGGGGGSDVTITPTYNQGKKIADYSIDGNEGAIYTPEIEITKNVLSGVKICEIEGVEIFAPSCGYIDTLGDSNIEQIGGFSQGANVTPVNVKRVSYTNDISNGEKIGSLTVGDTSYNVYQKTNIDTLLDFTPEHEKLIGTFFNKNVYMQVVPYAINLNNSWMQLNNLPIAPESVFLCVGLIVDSNNKVISFCSDIQYDSQSTPNQITRIRAAQFNSTHLLYIYTKSI